ncbi:MAG: hypothetical protein HY063_06370 [Bacteroidetes bacterium]|nr:hypothetical protein [Bacteroidota bacterium]
MKKCFQYLIIFVLADSEVLFNPAHRKPEKRYEQAPKYKRQFSIFRQLCKMTLLFSSDNYFNSRDNLSRLPRIHRGTVSQFADRRQNQKNTSSADNLSLCWTVAPAVTAFLKTIYNKVAGQLLSRFIVAQALTAMKNTGHRADNFATAYGRA